MIATGATGTDKLKISCSLTTFTPADEARGRHDLSGEIRCLINFVLLSACPVLYVQHIFLFLHSSRSINSHPLLYSLITLAARESFTKEWGKGLVAVKGTTVEMAALVGKACPG